MRPHDRAVFAPRSVLEAEIISDATELETPPAWSGGVIFKLRSMVYRPPPPPTVIDVL
jgi:hypothetical protein